MTPIDFAELAAPFPPSDLDWRVGNKSSKGDKATLLVYLTSRAVMNRLDDVVGPGRWSDSYTPLFEGGKIIGYLCTLSVEVEPGKWISKTDGADLTDIEAIKGGLSSALKRAAVKYGIGRYLYDVDSKFHPIREGYGPDDKSVYCPMGTDKKGPPGHIMIPTLADKFLPKPKGKPAKGKVVPDITPEDAALAEEIARERAAREAAEVARKKQHHESWEGAEQRTYGGAVSGMGLDVARSMDLAEHRGHPRPSAMDVPTRAKYLRWLQSDAGKQAYEDFKHEQAEMAARQEHA